MEKKCEHRNVQLWWRWFGKFIDHRPRLLGFERIGHDAETCLDCGHWLSLGPANITPEVEVEIRAASLAGLGEYESIRDAMTTGEYWGWHKAVSPHESDVVWFDEEPGYLARCIATHEEP